MLYQSKQGRHPLVRSSDYSAEFNKLSDEVKHEILKIRDRILSSSLPLPFLTEQALHLYNSIHYTSSDQQYQLQSK